MYERHPENLLWEYRPEKVDEYVAMLQAGSEPPPIVFHDGNLLDGRHRLEAWINVGRDPAKHPRTDLPAHEDPRAWLERNHVGVRPMSFTRQAEYIFRRMQERGETVDVALRTWPDQTSTPRLKFLVGRLQNPDAPRPARRRSAVTALADRASSRLEKTKIRSLEKSLLAIQQTVETFSALCSTPLPPIRRLELGSGLREATAIFGLSDVHCEETVRRGETPTGNEYNLDIAEHSIGRFFAGARWLIDLHRPKFQIRHAVCWLGGDLMTGHIHEELKESTAMAPIETIQWLRPRIKDGINSLLEDTKIERLLVPCSYGNHGRNTQKSFRALGAEHSYEWLLYQWLAHEFVENPRVQFLADKSAHQYLRVYDFDLHFHHGDETNYGGGVGGITIPLNKAIAQWDQAKKCHYHHFGHWHQYIDTGRIVVNGSVIGFNGYAMSIKATPEPPQQFFYLLDSKRGKTCKSPIWVRASGDNVRAA